MLEYCSNSTLHTEAQRKTSHNNLALGEESLEEYRGLYVHFRFLPMKT